MLSYNFHKVVGRLEPSCIEALYLRDSSNFWLISRALEETVMLSETLVASSSAPPKLTSAQSQQLKDAGIFEHTFQPQVKLDRVFKKSVVKPTCVALNEAHIFSAQSEKAVVHVYNREKGNQEAIVPFPEKLKSLAIALDGTVLILGAEGGGLYLWELCTGRQVSTSQSHLQAVTSLAVDISDNFVLSGSQDSNIHVWSLVDLLTLPALADSPQNGARTPRHALTGHRGPITSLTLGHSTTSVDVAISASSDETAIVWDYKQAVQLRTILLPSTPLCLTLDSGDRTLYAGIADGTVQIVDFSAHSSTQSIYSPSSTPVQPSLSDRLSHSSESSTSTGAALSVALSHDSTTLLTGHESGKIISWNIGRGSFKSLIAEYPEAPITNLQFLPPTGFPHEKPTRLKQQTVVKPKPNEAFSGPRGGHLSGTYSISAHFPTASDDSGASQEFERALASPLISDDLLAESMYELQHPETTTKSNDVNGGSLDGSSDFVSLGAAEPADSRVVEEVKHLKAQVEHLREVQKISNRHVDQLVKEKTELKRRDEVAKGRRNAKRLKVENDAARNWGKQGVNGDAGQMDVDDGSDRHESSGAEVERMD